MRGKPRNTVERRGKARKGASYTVKTFVFLSRLTAKGILQKLTEATEKILSPGTPEKTRLKVNMVNNPHKHWSF